MLQPTPPKSRHIDSVERKDDRLILSSEHGVLFLEPKSENIVRVIYSVDRKLSDKEKPGVIRKETYGEWSYIEESDAVYVSLPGLSLNISKTTGSITYFDKKGTEIFKERENDPKEFEEFETYMLADVEQKTKIIDTADGKKEVLEEAKKIPAGKSYHIRFNIELGDEALYGMGQQEKGFASLRGRTLYIHQGNRKIAIPMFVSTKGYGILIDTYSPLIFNDNINGSYIYTEADKESDYYFIMGDKNPNIEQKSYVNHGMNAVIKGYRFLTGKASMLPKWAFGYIQSQERYETEEEILCTAKKSRELGIGMDCIVLDWMSWNYGEWGQKSYDESRFPDPKRMIDKLHDEHIHFMLSIWPTMSENTDNYREFAEKKLFLPACTVYNALEEAGRKLYFDQLKRTHLAYGTDAWWCDSSEPFTPEWNQRMRPEEGDLYQKFCEEAGLRMPYEYCNSYPLYHAMGIYENQREATSCNNRMKSAEKAEHGTMSCGSQCEIYDEEFAFTPEKRVCNLTRSAYTGQQRYGTIMWSGDTDASWETFRDQIAIGLHFSASGLPYWTMDTGAFFVKKGNIWYWNGHYDDTIDNKGYCELYTRWYQFAAFLPVFRAHGTDCRRELWNFKDEFYDAMLKANRLRYSLMPYIYSEAGKVWLEDRSMIRWLAFDHADDRETWEITDQYMFGESLMVCPVTEPMYYDENGDAIATANYAGNSVATTDCVGNSGATTGVEKTREVYFPKGCGWYDYYTKERYEGGSRVKVAAPLDVIPLFVKEGSIIPVRKPVLSTEEQTDEISYLIFSEDEAEYELYEDAGDGYAYEQGEYKVTKIVRNGK